MPAIHTALYAGLHAARHANRHAALLATIASLVGPDFGAVGGANRMRQVVGGLLTYGLLIAVLMTVVCATTWAVGSSNGNWQSASRAKTGVLIALGGAVLTGGALAFANWLLDLGASL